MILAIGKTIIQTYRRIALCPQGVKIYLPNVITNANTDESVFYPQTGKTDLVIEELSIYDRWGNLVFYNEAFPANNPQLGWNGTMDGSTVEQGVYVYTLRFNDGLSSILRHGDVTVLR